MGYELLRVNWSAIGIIIERSVGMSSSFVGFPFTPQMIEFVKKLSFIPAESMRVNQKFISLQDFVDDNWWGIFNRQHIPEHYRWQFLPKEPKSALVMDLQLSKSNHLVPCNPLNLLANNKSSIVTYEFTSHAIERLRKSKQYGYKNTNSTDRENEVKKQWERWMFDLHCTRRGNGPIIYDCLIPDRPEQISKLRSRM